jgi:hypothetical protein
MKEMAENLASLYVGDIFPIDVILNMARQQKISRNVVKRKIISLILKKRDELWHEKRKEIHITKYNWKEAQVVYDKYTDLFIELYKKFITIVLYKKANSKKFITFYDFEHKFPKNFINSIYVFNS